MIKEFLWEAFTVTGNIETYVLYKQMEIDVQKSEDLNLEEENLLALQT